MHRARKCFKLMELRLWACSSAGRAPALQARSITPNAPSFAFGFHCFQQFRGICFSLEVNPETAIT